WAPAELMTRGLNPLSCWTSLVKNETGRLLACATSTAVSQSSAFVGAALFDRSDESEPTSAGASRSDDGTDCAPDPCGSGEATEAMPAGVAGGVCSGEVGLK